MIANRIKIAKENDFGYLSDLRNTLLIINGNYLTFMIINLIMYMSEKLFPIIMREEFYLHGTTWVISMPPLEIYMFISKGYYPIYKQRYNERVASFKGLYHLLILH